MNQMRTKKEKGFSLIEMMIVLIIVGMLTAFILPLFRNTAGDGKKVISQIERSLQERRTSAIQLNQGNKEGNRIGQPVTIDFKNLSTTAQLKIEGEDINRDGIEDRSGARLTRLNGSTGNWDYSYEGRPIELPAGWSVVSSQIELGTIPMIPNAQLVTSIGFDENGRPVGTPAVAATTGRDEAPFFVVCARDTKATNIAIAVAIHPSGLIEKWTYNFSDGKWNGNGGRQ